MDSQKLYSLHLEAIQEEEEEGEDGAGNKAQASVALDMEQSSGQSSEKSSEYLEEESEEEIFADTPLRARSSRRRRPRPSMSGLPKSKSSLSNGSDASPQKVRRKRRTKVDLFPDWVVQLMLNIEEATRHKLVVE